MADADNVYVVPPSIVEPAALLCDCCGRYAYSLGCNGRCVHDVTVTYVTSFTAPRPGQAPATPATSEHVDNTYDASNVITACTKSFDNHCRIMTVWQ